MSSSCTLRYVPGKERRLAAIAMTPGAFMTGGPSCELLCRRCVLLQDRCSLAFLHRSPGNLDALAKGCRLASHVQRRPSVQEHEVHDRALEIPGDKLSQHVCVLVWLPRR